MLKFYIILLGEEVIDMEQYIPYLIDGFLILFLIIRFVRGYNKGFIREIFSLILNVGAIVLLILYLNPLRDFLVKYIDIAKIVGEKSNKWINYLLSMSKYLVVTLIILIAFSLISKLLTLWTKKLVQRLRDDHPTFASFDKCGGFLFGLVNGLITLAIVCYIAFQPIFLPQGQEYLQKTQFATTIYDMTEKGLVKVAKVEKEKVNEIIIKYLLGTELEKSETDEFKSRTLAKLIIDIPTLISNPQKLLDAKGTENQSIVIFNYISDISAFADLTSKVPEDAELNKRFGLIYDHLVSQLPDVVIHNINELEYNAMFDEETGTFYQVGLSQEQINALKSKCVPDIE